MRKNKFLILFLSFVFLGAPLYAQEIKSEDKDDAFKTNLDNIDSSRFYGRATLQVLNKTTAKTLVIDAKVGEEVEYGKITIIVKKCWQAPLDQKPDSRVLMEIYENKPDAPRNRIFYGWMISSSPSISSMEHPIYDVIALSCKNK